MRKPENKKLLKPALAAASLSLVMGLSLTACVPSTNQAMEGDGEVPVSVLDQMNSRPNAQWHEEGLSKTLENLEQKAKDYAPEVRTLEDGTQVQRTPEGDFWVSELSEVDSTYNTYLLNADARGCEACHTEGLEKVVQGMEYPHWPIGNGLDTNIDVQDCMWCHTEIVGQKVPFSQMIHGIHSKDSFKEMGGDCMSCHAPASDTREGLSLWDAVKHEQLSGINDVEDVQGNFSFDQTTTAGYDSTFRLTDTPMDGWITEQFGNDAYSNKVGSIEDRDAWEYSVSGMVNKPFKTTLGELIAEAPVEEFYTKLHCMEDGPNGAMLGNYKVKAIPISWLIEKAGGLKEGAVGLNATNGDGGSAHYEQDLADMEKYGGWLVFEINDRPLTYLEGFPCRTWYPQYYAAASTRWNNGIIPVDSTAGSLQGAGSNGWNRGDQDPRGTQFGWRDMYLGEEYPEDIWLDKPNCAIRLTPEGKIIPVGQPYTFEGYADAWEDQIVAIEFSMDGGETWTRYETPDQDPIAWTYWRFQWTPEEPGAYVLKVRAVTNTGHTTPLPDEVMVNAK